jgi:hypothetical protein
MEIKYLLIFLLVILLFISSTVAAENEGLALRTFDFPAAERSDPFEIMYPFELTGYGRIRISFKIYEPEEISSDMYHNTVVELILLDKRAIKDYTPTLWDEMKEKVDTYTDYTVLYFFKNFYSFLDYVFGGDEDPPPYLHAKVNVRDRPRIITHNVDSSELQQSDGKYILIIRHKGGFPIKGVFQISYPGEKFDFDPEVDKYRNEKADLIINKLMLNEENKLVVEMTNIGEGFPNANLWNLRENERVVLEVDVNGQKHQRYLEEFDPDKDLQTSMKNIRYTFHDIIITDTTEVSAEIDSENVMVEAFENNNQRTVELPEPLKVVGTAKIKPKGNFKIVTPKPDLELESVVLNNRNEIVVRIYSRGAPLNDNYWSGDNRPLLNININGSGVSNSSINAFDPNKRLKEKDGFAVHNTGIVLEEPAVVRAEVDYLNRLEETNENNNVKEVNLEP